MSPVGVPRVDPITLGVLRNALPAIANEMSLDLQRSSYNMMIYDVGDYSCAILRPDGALIAQNVGGVSHFISDLGVVIRDGVRRYGLDGWSPGDVVLTNHQAVAGQHLNNVVVYTPVFFDYTLIGFAAIRAHWIDVGGLSTGFGASASAFDPWSEGLQLDQIKVWEAGISDDKALKLILDNIRFPEASLGDLRSQIAACRLAERRVAELYRRYGSDVVEAAIGAIFEETELRCRRAVAAMPDGVYEAESLLDGAPDDRVEIRVKVTIAGDAMDIDLSGCSPERPRGPNARTLAGALIAYKALTTPDEPVNEGSFAAATVNIPEGTLMMARFPAPMAAWSDILPTVVDTIFRALAVAIPDRVAAGHFGDLGTAVVFFGTDPRTGRRFVSQSLEGGGWGGRPFEDGESASISICQGDVRNSPIENIEIKVPMLVEERALRRDSGGAGRFRGGLGLSVRVRALAEGRWTIYRSERAGLAPWGLAGGAAGTQPETLMRKPDAARFTAVGTFSDLTPRDTVVVYKTAGGGGWGSPLERDPDRVLDDVREGYISAEAAELAYGVVLTGDSNAVDELATYKLRRSGRLPHEA